MQDKCWNMASATVYAGWLDVKKTVAYVKESNRKTCTVLNVLTKKEKKVRIKASISVATGVFLLNRCLCVCVRKSA